jgi:hypothetical protein
MRAPLLQDRIWRGLGQGARVLGAACTLYRAAGPDHPLRGNNVVMRLHAAFAPLKGGWDRPVPHGHPLWQGVFDGAYVRAGDYLHRAESRPGAADGGVWFVAALQPLLPALCVRASRVVDFSRPAAPASAGVNDYGGVGDSASEPLLSNWPASVLDAGAGGAYQANLPTGTALGAWDVLLTGYAGVTLRAGDHMSDDLGRTGVVAAAELSELGWRLHVTQAAT